MLESFSNKIASLQPTALLKQTPAEMFFYKLTNLFLGASFYRTSQDDCLLAWYIQASKSTNSLQPV